MKKLAAQMAHTHLSTCPNKFNKILFLFFDFQDKSLEISLQALRAGLWVKGNLCDLILRFLFSRFSEIISFNSYKSKYFAGDKLKQHRVQNRWRNFPITF